MQRIIDNVRLVLGWVAFPVLVLRFAVYCGFDVPLWAEYVAVALGAGYALYLAFKSKLSSSPLTLVTPGDGAVKNIDSYGQFTVDMWMGSPEDNLGEKDLSIMGYGLAGETGEVMEILKKRLRDDTFDRAHLRKELGDVAFYWARLCRAFGFQPSEVLGANVEKVAGRKDRGTLGGSGDDR